MCYGFVGKTFNLNPNAAGTKMLRRKMNDNKSFNRKSLPEFRNRQLQLAMEGRGMYSKFEIDVDVKKTMQASRGGPSFDNNRRGHYYNNGNLLSSSGGSGSKRQQLNPQLSVNRPEVRKALTEARRTLALSEGKSNRKR